MRFEACNEMKVKTADEEPSNLEMRLPRLYQMLIRNAKRLKDIAASQYDRAVFETKFEVGDSVILWDVEIDGNKIVKAWMGPYVIIEMLVLVLYELNSEIGNPVARVHVNRLKRLGNTAADTRDSVDGVFPNCPRAGKRLVRSEKNTAIMTKLKGGLKYALMV